MYLCVGLILEATTQKNCEKWLLKRLNRTLTFEFARNFMVQLLSVYYKNLNITKKYSSKDLKYLRQVRKYADDTNYFIANFENIF